ncbi:DUF2069 domain-containing protein [Glaciecola petra]|uniref:DUF2069 domain-containing protein n=1 Tax=Glaciecola petra TaxID=3075602 RepID=A0ABU2ZNU9_9ALTE|nr:DUF2069 domain-containing protein [Aestuariibacter sp. P117]MDT0594301.1 DUF2069 domain-containing protein [Aestuariibacter sp. P117]
MQSEQLPPVMSSQVLLFRRIALFSHLGLLLWLSIWYFALSSDQEYSTLFIIVIYLLPLLLPLLGIIKAKPYTHAWSCFIVLWYFLHAITVIYAEPAYIMHATLELLLACGMFVGCSMFARLRGQELGTSLPKLSKVMEDEKALFEGVKKNE